MKNVLTRILLALLIALSMLLAGCSAPDNGNNPGGGDDNGITDGGNTEGGNTDGGNTEGGNTEGGNTEGGNTEGGNTEGGNTEGGNTEGGNTEDEEKKTVTLDEIPAYTDKPYIEINGNIPLFTKSEMSTTSFVRYTDLDALGRCGAALAALGRDLMPTDDRESIGHISPSGWEYNGQSNNKTYPEVMGQNTLYNRTHLLAHQLVSEDVDKRNLITATQYLNQTNMVPFENLVADYVKETGNHVMYRVTPMFKDDNLVATGVLMEAWSVEDDGEGVCFCVFLYNVQPGIVINYLTGESELAEVEKPDDEFVGATELPNENTEYYIYAYAENLGVNYFVSDTSSNTLGTSTEKADAIKVKFEAAGDGYYYIYFMSGSDKVYINMTKDATTSFGTSKDKSAVTAWKIDLAKKQIVNKTYSKRAMAFYADKSEIRNYATSQNNIWVWFGEA